MCLRLKGKPGWEFEAPSRTEVYEPNADELSGKEGEGERVRRPSKDFRITYFKSISYMYFITPLA